MHKIWLIIQREYLTRVKNKRFLLVTFLMPLLIIGLIFGSAYLTSTGAEHRKIAVVDPNGFIKTSLKNTHLKMDCSQLQPQKMKTVNRKFKISCA